MKKKRRCGLPSVDEYVKDSDSLFLDHLHNMLEEDFLKKIQRLGDE